ARMGPSSVVEVEIPADRMSRLADGFVGSQIDLLVFDAALAGEQAGKAEPVNCEPWSVLNISGLPWRAKASSRVSTQKAASIVIDNRQDRTRRVAQSSTTAR